MKLVKIIFFMGLVAYSVALLYVELKHGQCAVRGFYSDIMIGKEYPLTYKSSFGINTSISFLLLCSTALLYLLCLAVSKGSDWKSTVFCWSQAALFLYLAGDERLQFHEWLGVHLGINDALILLVLGGLEVLLLFYVGNVRNQTWKTNFPLLACGFFFGVMTIVDGFLPLEWTGRLAAEDLSKLWGVIFLFAYAWNHCAGHMLYSTEAVRA